MTLPLTRFWCPIRSFRVHVGMLQPVPFPIVFRRTTPKARCWGRLNCRPHHWAMIMNTLSNGDSEGSDRQRDPSGLGKGPARWLAVCTWTVKSDTKTIFSLLSLAPVVLARRLTWDCMLLTSVHRTRVS